MGIMTRREGDWFVITSDRTSKTAATKKAPRVSEVHEVWTGTHWSTDMAAAIKFESPDAADEYVRANFIRVTA